MNHKAEETPPFFIVFRPTALPNKKNALMLFNSYPFIFGFLPAALVGFFLISKFGRAYGASFLALASLFFYGYWNYMYVGLLLASIISNFYLGMKLSHYSSTSKIDRGSLLLKVGVAANLGLLGYYKYYDFFVGAVNESIGTIFPMQHIVLPLGISFFTFTQIAFLVDAHQGKVREHSLIHYTLFVTYFPHLIAGPVLHHKEMMPQFEKPSTYQVSSSNLLIGLTIFGIGLFKKVVLADGISKYVEPVFGGPAIGLTPSFGEAWAGALAYTLQLYFDFSGYTDMAIGLSRCFGIQLPINFNSPYKADSIIEFWRRWHITLSRFLRDYLYIPLGGNKLGSARRYSNLMITMLLGGLWHGPAITFIVWGGLHGVYLAVNHAWRTLLADISLPNSFAWMMKPLRIFITFIAVVVAWVFFRADSLHTAITILGAMAAFDFTISENLVDKEVWTWIILLLGIAWFAPNTQEIMANYEPGLGASNTANRHFHWKPSLLRVLIFGFMTWVALSSMVEDSEFLYYQF